MDDAIDSEQLWLKTNSFLQTDFDSETYISERIRTFAPFAKFQTELQSHLSSLKAEIMKVILSTKLADNNDSSMLVRMRAPLHNKISMFRDSVNSSLSALQNGLRQRSAASSAIEVAELLLDTFHVISKVVYCLITELERDYLDHVLQHLGACPSKVHDSMKHSILQGGKVMKDAVSQIMHTMTRILVFKSMDDFCRQLIGIAATYRRTNKPVPVTHSPFIFGVLRPLKLLHHFQVFLEGERAKTCLSAEAMKELLHRAAKDITGRYYEHVADVVNAAKKAEYGHQRIRQDAQSVIDKICMQLFLDIQEYGRNLEDLGVNAANINMYRSMLMGVAPDMQSAIF